MAVYILIQPQDPFDALKFYNRLFSPEGCHDTISPAFKRPLVDCKLGTEVLHRRKMAFFGKNSI